MAAVVGLKNPSLDLNKSLYEEIDGMPLMASPGPVMMILAMYLIFVIKLGPDFMRKREGYKMTKTLLVYNGLQVIISAYLVQHCLNLLLITGLTPKKCYMQDDNVRKKILDAIWIYFAAKLSEFLDTIFFVLRKKNNQVTFLHLYHHSIMMIGTWASLKYWPSECFLYIGFINSLVHVFMYTYYGLSALGPNVAKYLKWKKYMTKFQLVQFVTIIIQYLASVRLSECPPSKGVAIFVACNTVFILLLFVNFYRQSYRDRRPKLNGVSYQSSKLEKVQ